MKQIKVKGGFNRFRIVDAGGFTVGIIEITQIGVEAEIGIVEKGEGYQRFEMMHSLKGVSKKRPRTEEKPQRRRDQISGALGKIKGGLSSLWNASKMIYNFLITGNNFMLVVIGLILVYAAIMMALGGIE